MTIIWILALYGLFFALFRSKISSKIKVYRLFSWNSLLRELYTCSFCLGFWHSLFVALMLNPLGETPISILLFALAGASGCYIIEGLMTKLES